MYVGLSGHCCEALALFGWLTPKCNLLPNNSQSGLVDGNLHKRHTDMVNDQGYIKPPLVNTKFCSCCSSYNPLVSTS